MPDEIRAYDPFRYNDVALDKPPRFMEPPRPGDLMDWYAKLQADLYGTRHNIADQGIVTGPGKEAFLSQLPPRLAAFMQNMGNVLRVAGRGTKMSGDADAAMFSPSRTNLGNIYWNQLDPETATHEALHALAYRKNFQNVSPFTSSQGMVSFQPRAEQIADKMLTRDPSLQRFGYMYATSGYQWPQIMDEVATQGMTENILRRQLPQWWQANPNKSY